jgi:hypothetical protein
MKIYTTKRGFTIFFAVLVSSLALAVGLSIYDLLLRETALSQTSRESQYAIFAADAGAECALYWDNKAPLLNGATSVFGTSSSATWGTPTIPCGLKADGVTPQDITTQGPPPIDITAGTFSDSSLYNCTASTAWCTVKAATAATTTFRMDFNAGTPTVSYCAIVIVVKWGDPSQTTVTSHGYNNCTTNGTVRLERALQVSY